MRKWGSEHAVKDLVAMATQKLAMSQFSFCCKNESLVGCINRTGCSLKGMWNRLLMVLLVLQLSTVQRFVCDPNGESRRKQVELWKPRLLRKSWSTDRFTLNVRRGIVSVCTEINSISNSQLGPAVSQYWLRTQWYPWRWVYTTNFIICGFRMFLSQTESPWR